MSANLTEGAVQDGAQAAFNVQKIYAKDVSFEAPNAPLVFNEQGLVTMHRDYWDAAEELYEKLPLLGGLMRWLKRRANT